MNQQTKSFLEDIANKPGALRDLVGYYGSEGRERLDQWAKRAKEIGRVNFSGMGTSHFTAEFIIAHMAEGGVDASAIDASELLYYPRPINGLLALISQSGESVEIKKLADRITDRQNLIALTNNMDSTLGKAAGFVLPMCAGFEHSVASKTYVNTGALLYLMSLALRGQSDVEAGLIELGKVADAMEKAEQNRANIERAADLLYDAPTIQMISRGPSVIACKQAALTFMEGAQIPSCPFTGAAFRHGSFEIVDERTRAIFFIPSGNTTDLLISMAKEVVEKGGKVVAITDVEMTLPEKNGQVLNVPKVSETLFALTCSSTHDLLLDIIAKRRGLVAGEYRYGSKVTSVE